MSRNFDFVCVLLKSVLINTITYVLLSTKSLAYTRHATLNLLALNPFTHSLYHFENPAILAIKSGIVTLIHVKSI